MTDHQDDGPGADDLAWWNAVTGSSQPPEPQPAPTPVEVTVNPPRREAPTGPAPKAKKAADPQGDQVAGAASEKKKAAGPSQATKAIALAEKHFDLGVATSGETFAVERGGPNIAHPMRGSRSLRARLANLYLDHHRHTASSGALADALLVLEGRAQRLDPVDLPVRVAQVDDEIVVDLGRPAGDAVRIRPGRWEYLERSPVLFRRTKLTGSLPIPAAGGTIDELAEHVRIADTDWPMLLAWLVASLLADLPCPGILLSGEQGTSKTTTARRAVALTDPSTAAVRPAPSDPGEWAVTASASRVIALDNLSGIAGWLSDALCRAVTGGGFVKRELYSDADLVVLEIRRAIIITAIDAGSLRGDLADRLVSIELERIPEHQRRDEASLADEFTEALPRLVGALYTLTAQVLEVLPTVHPPNLPRMADYARILAAIDQILGTDGLTTYLGAGQRLAADVVDGDLVASAVRDFTIAEGYWCGTPADLWKKLTPSPTVKEWPKAAHTFSARIKRAAPALRQLSIDVELDRSKSARVVRLHHNTEGDASPNASVTHDPASVTHGPDDAPDDADDASMTLLASPPDPNDPGEF